MSIQRAEKDFDYIDSSGNKVRKRVISPGAAWGEHVAGTTAPVSNRFEDLTEGQLGDKGMWGICYLTPITSTLVYEEFYYGQDYFRLGEKLIQGCFGSVENCIDTLMQIMNDKLASNQTGVVDLRHDARFNSKEQGMYGWGESFVHPTFALRVVSNTFNPSTLRRDCVCTIDLKLEPPVTFNEETGLWNDASGDEIIFQVKCDGLYNANNFRTALTRVFESAVKTRIKPCAGFGVLPTWTFTKGSDFAQKVWYWAYIEQDNVIAPNLEMVNMLSPFYGARINYYAAGMGGNWNEDGSVDPEPPEPEPEPEPYPPPKPGPDDPPDPIDPDDPVPEPDDPPLDGTNCGIYSVYNPSRTALRQLGAKLWDPNVWDIIKQYFTTPMEALLSLSIIPVTPSTSSAEAIVIGNYNSHVGAPVVNSDYVTFNCGSVYIPRFFGSYLDYDPYTTYKLYLPYIGEVDLNADEITAETITIKYKVNVVSGDCVALCMKNNNVFAEFNGNCARFLPLSQASWSSFVQAAASFASAAIAGGVSLAGSGATGEAIEA